jgi:hypothetical protein
MARRPFPFCVSARDRILHAFDAALVLRDGFPISPGHTLIVPRRQVASFFALEAGEQAAMLDALTWAHADGDQLKLLHSDGAAAETQRMDRPIPAACSDVPATLHRPRRAVAWAKPMATPRGPVEVAR